MPIKIPNVTAGEFRPQSHPPNMARMIAAVAVLFLFLILGATANYTIATDEVGVVQRFGKFHATTNPGLHFKLPFGIDTVTKVKVLQRMKEEFGFRTVKSDVQSEFQGPKENENLRNEALMVTGDLNMTSVEWIIQYRVSDPFEYLFKMREPRQTLRDATESVMREVIGDRTVDEALTFGRTEIEQKAMVNLQTLITGYHMGIKIEQLIIQHVAPPAKKVEDSFSDVNQAQQERERMILEARAEYNKAVPRAKGEALQKIQEAEGYATKRVNEATGDANRFTAMLTAYQRAPEVTRRRIYLETMGEVIPKLGRKVIVDSDVKQFLPLFSMGEGQEVAK